MYYEGTIYMGPYKQPLSVVWDTGSDWLVVASYLCKTCTGDTTTTKIVPQCRIYLTLTSLEVMDKGMHMATR